MKAPRTMQELPLTPGNYARLESIAAEIVNRGGTIPPHFAQWQQAAHEYFNNLPYDQQNAVLGELNTARARAASHIATTEQAVGRALADQYFHDMSRGLGGSMEGVGAAKLKQIAENPLNVKETRVAKRDAAGRAVTDQYTRRPVYETKRTETRPYSDDQSRRAALVLSFAKHEARAAALKGDHRSGEIDPAYINSPHERTRDVSEAFLECETRAALGEDLPTAEPTHTGSDRGYAAIND